MKEKIRIGFVGCGQFCKNFVPIFRAHPAVEYVAVCDKFEMLASPVCMINQTDSGKLIEEIKLLAQKHKAEEIVVGLPKNMDGSMGFRSEACQALGTLIQSLTEIPVVYWDERLTTVSAHRILSENNVRGKKRKNVVDAVAADIILQDYIDSRKNR